MVVRTMIRSERSSNAAASMAFCSSSQRIMASRTSSEGASISRLSKSTRRTRCFAMARKRASCNGGRSASTGRPCWDTTRHSRRAVNWKEKRAMKASYRQRRPPRHGPARLALAAAAQGRPGRRSQPQGSARTGPARGCRARRASARARRTRASPPRPALTPGSAGAHGSSGPGPRIPRPVRPPPRPQQRPFWPPHRPFYEKTAPALRPPLARAAAASGAPSTRPSGAWQAGGAALP
jgi:hypothetical protein